MGSTPLGNDYEFEFARELITYERLGNGSATDLLIVSLSANDILGHKVGPDSVEMKSMALALDRQLAGFFEFLGHQIGLANIWIALSADHGIAPVPASPRVCAFQRLTFQARENGCADTTMRNFPHGPSPLNIYEEY